ILPESAKVADVYLACRKVGIFLNTAQQNPSA
ncbi:head decoration protein, partial [Salmonella enterica subsp. enterica]|nr:head decoration protein [Salmonella enterica subsp. enterica]